ncbi:MAG: DUF7714 family protein [Pseudomonadales bacterium]
MADGEVLRVDKLRQQQNLVPLPYRRVSYQPYDGAMTESAIREHLMAREIYRRTDIVVLHAANGEHAVAAIQRVASEGLFTRAEAIEILALTDACVFIEDSETDTANRSALAKAARAHNVSADQTAIVQGLFDHINIIHRPNPLLLRVVEVAPPEPPKLYQMAEHVLSYADLPPMCLQLELIELRSLCASLQPKAYLVPCRSGGLDDLNAPVYFLDERPAERQDWTLIGCERSLQFHRHYYGDEPPRVEICPRQMTGVPDRPTLLKCCLLEFGIEHEDDLAVVPWGADLAMVEDALRRVSAGVDYG